MKKFFQVENLLWLALALALAGSLKHLAAIFAGIDGNLFMGWLQAIAIDIGLFALAYSIRIRKAAGRNLKAVWFGVTLFTAISIYGNLAYGLLATTGQLPTLILDSRPYVLAASLPILVLFLSELISGDRGHLPTIVKKVSNRTKPPVLSLRTDRPEAPAGVRKTSTNKIERQQRLLDYHQQNPTASMPTAAKELGLSRGTIRNYAVELGLEFNHSNGHNSFGPAQDRPFGPAQDRPFGPAQDRQ